jgi:hypothetical protein
MIPSKQDIINHGNRNIVMFSATAALGCVMAYALDMNVTFFLGIIVGASLQTVIFQSANTRTFILMADMIEGIRAEKAKNSQK